MTDRTVKVKVFSPLACFSNPAMKVERSSYEVPTPSAARGVLDAICWRPQMRWVVRSIQVLNEIRFTSFRRNEIQSKVAPGAVKKWMADSTTYRPQPAGAGSSDATPRNTLALRDVAYIIEAEPLVFEPNGEDTPAKYIAMFNRRVEKGQCHARPYLGCREFACDFEPPGGDERPIDETRDLGLILYDIIFDGQGKNNRAVFFNARMVNGVIDTHPDRVIDDPQIRKEILVCSSKR